MRKKKNLQGRKGDLMVFGRRKSHRKKSIPSKASNGRIPPTSDEKKGKRRKRVLRKNQGIKIVVKIRLCGVRKKRKSETIYSRMSLTDDADRKVGNSGKEETTKKN